MKKWFYVIALMQTGCSPIYYSPTTQNVPLFTEGGQTRIAVGGNTARLELNSAYAITHRLAVQANGGLLFPKDLDNGNGGSGGFIEAGAGYYMPVGDNFVFESFGLVAYGSVENHFPSTVSDNPGTTGNIRSNLVRYGIQPAIGFKSRFFTMAFSTRMAGLCFVNAEGNLMFNNQDQVHYLHENHIHFLMEPALTVSGGPEKIKIQFQLSKSYNLTMPAFRQDNTLLTVGLGFGF